jgi:uncharacterized protein YbjT (DUF2867 family)
MQVLIAGASGAIGRALVRRLRASQHPGQSDACLPDATTRATDEGGESGDQERADLYGHHRSF